MTIALEALAYGDFYIWHCFFGMPEGSGMAQWLFVAVTQGPENRFKFSEGKCFFHPGLSPLGNFGLWQ